MIVELFGLPGSGKSYLANQLVDELRKENVDAVNMTELSRNKLICKAKKKIIYASLNVNPGIKEIKDEIKACFQHPDSFSSLFGLYRSTEYCLDSLAVMLFYYHKLSKKNKVYFFDEGTLHTLIKLFGDFEIPESELYKVIEKIKERLENEGVICIYNKMDVASCIVSIEKRNRKSCLFDTLNGEVLHNILCRYHYACELAQKNVNAMIVERVENDQNKISRIINEIRIRRARI